LFFYVCFLSGELNPLYNNGVLLLKSCPGFGKKTDWQTLFYDTYKHMVIAPDGSIFVSNSRQHNIMKFDNTGTLIKKFAQKGQGPGDTVYPSDLGILDGKYLVVGEYAENRKISLFDLNGQLIKVIRTQYPVFNSLGLKDNNIALLKLNFPGKGTTRYTVIIRNIETGKESDIAHFTSSEKFAYIGNTQFFPGKFNGDVILSKTIDGNLIVGFTTEKKISIYSPEGKVIKTFLLKASPRRVTGDMIAAYKEFIVNDSKERHFGEEFIKKIAALSFKSLIPEYLPFFKNIIVTSDNHIWIMESSHLLLKCNNRVQVYSSDGISMGRFTIDFGDFKPNNLAPMAIYNGFLYGLFEEKNSDDVFLRIIKVDLQKKGGNHEYKNRFGRAFQR
jgi:WD40 repeat protein